MEYEFAGMIESAGEERCVIGEGVVIDESGDECIELFAALRFTCVSDEFLWVGAATGCALWGECVGVDFGGAALGLVVVEEFVEFREVGAGCFGGMNASSGAAAGGSVSVFFAAPVLNHGSCSHV